MKRLTSFVLCSLAVLAVSTNALAGGTLSIDNMSDRTGKPGKAPIHEEWAGDPIIFPWLTNHE